MLLFSNASYYVDIFMKQAVSLNAKLTFKDVGLS